MQNGMYLLRETVQQDFCFSLHEILAHQSKKSIESTLKAYGIQGDDDNKTDDQCRFVLEGKMLHLYFTPSSTEVREVGDLVVSDFAGPISSASPSGSKYVQIIFDVHSAYGMKFFEKEISGPVQFKNSLTFKALLKNVSQKTIKTVRRYRSDNGGNYVWHHFREYLNFEGTIHPKSTAHQPQQNGHAERHPLQWNKNTIFQLKCTKEVLD